MTFGKEFEKTDRIGVEPPRCYYIPFSTEQEFAFKNGIIDRTRSDRFISLDGVWQIKEHGRLSDVRLDESITEEIPVPSCVQMHGYDGIQYINFRYPFPYDPPYVPKENPTYHYRRVFSIPDSDDKYYLNFEGVDSAFYVFVNGKKVGYGQISHATNEFDITEFVRFGENVLDVVVLKWCASSYLECQDKFRFTGIFRSVYILKRPNEHITDFKIDTRINGSDGVIVIKNESDVPFDYAVAGKSGKIAPETSAEIIVENAEIWTADNPSLYDLILTANGEKILQRVGIRTVEIVGGVFKINGKHLKLKGVNRHDMNPVTGATVTVDDIVQDLKTMKWANINAIRTSHYPNMPEFYEFCDLYGFYLIGEADLENHGACIYKTTVDRKAWQDVADSGMYDEAVFDRHLNMIEREKNHACIVIWSLGNESSFGKMFYKGIKYIKNRDSRPIQYESVWESDQREYYTSGVDIAGRMYASPEWCANDYLNDEKETRPLVLCEYSHAMGNSNGDLNDYWKIFDGNDRFIGGFIWEWRSHAIKTEKGYLYGGDFGEKEHDENFCVDGMMMPDLSVKPNALEIRAVYGGKREYAVVLPETSLPKADSDCPAVINVTEDAFITAIGDAEFKVPFGINIIRAYIDNDMFVKTGWRWFENYKQTVYKTENIDGATVYHGKIVVNCYAPIMKFTVSVKPVDFGADVTLEYEVADYIKYLPRIGFEFAIDKKYDKFSYYGYGENESYIDKHMSSELGVYESTAEKNYFHYVKPQESGSHFGTARVKIDGLMEVTAEKPFSFSINPYSTKQLITAKHDFELESDGNIYVNLDIAMSGVGTNSCGPELNEKYRAPKQGKNTFRIKLI